MAIYINIKKIIEPFTKKIKDLLTLIISYGGIWKIFYSWTRMNEKNILGEFHSYFIGWDS